MEPSHHFSQCVGGGLMHALHWPGPVGRTPVVLVHGLGMSSRYMVRAGQRLSVHAEVWAPDLPGFGDSDRGGPVLNVPQLATALAHWCDTTSLPSAVFVGHSLGCQVVVELASRFSRAVAGLVLAAPTIDPSARSSLRQIGRMLPDIAREPLSLMSIVVAAYLQAGLPRVARTLSLMVQDRIEQKLPQLSVPALVIQGERDRVVPPAWSKQVARLIPGCRYAVISGGAHGFNYAKPIAFAAAIQDFLEVTPPPR